MTRIAALALLGITAAGVAGQEVPCDREGLGAVIAAHVARYPRMQVQDAYKLLHQGVFGPEHAIPDPATARGWLEAEVDALDSTPPPPDPPTDPSKDPLIEPIAPAGRLVRVHIRPFLAAGGDREDLLAAFVDTSRRVRGSVAEYECAARLLGESPVGNWSRADWQAFSSEMIERGLPAIGHSEDFEEAYQPAYRVVAGELVSVLLGQER